jgi:hypothetical protein
MRLIPRLASAAGLACLSACVPTEVVKQEIPVSSNPLGATVLVDGVPVGTTPRRIALARDQNYVLTLMKDGYEQEDVTIMRRYQSDRVLMTAVQAGVNSALFFKDTGLGVQRGLGSISSQEATGEAYVLEPAAVTVNLRPSGSSAVAEAPAVGATEVSTGVSSSSAQRSGNGSVMGASPGAAAAAGALAAAAAARPVEKRWTTSSSSKTKVRADGSVVTRSSGTSVGVGVNPAGLVNLVDTLFTQGGLQ